MDTPTLAEALSAALDARASQIRTALPGVVVEYHRTLQTADIRPTVWPDGEEAPILPSVPVVWPRGGGGYLVFDLTEDSKFVPGDTGLIIVCEADLAEWRRTGEAGPPADAARHHLQNAVFIPGLVPAGREFAHFAGSAVLDGAGDLRLGGALASHALAFGDLWSGDFNTWRVAHTAWVTAIVGAVPALAGAGATMQAADTALASALALHLSTVVKTK